MWWLQAKCPRNISLEEETSHEVLHDVFTSDPWSQGLQTRQQEEGAPKPCRRSAARGAGRLACRTQQLPPVARCEKVELHSACTPRQRTPLFASNCPGRGIRARPPLRVLRAERNSYWKSTHISKDGNDFSASVSCLEKSHQKEIWKSGPRVFSSSTPRARRNSEWSEPRRQRYPSRSSPRTSGPVTKCSTTSSQLTVVTGPESRARQ